MVKCTSFIHKILVISRKIRTFFAVLFSKTDYSFKKTFILRKAIKPLMLSRYGKIIRKVFPIFRPWCAMFPRQMIVILSDGSVTTCCMDPFGENRFGSVYKQDISEIWKETISNFVRYGDLYDYKKCRECIGSIYSPLLSKKSDYLKWKKSLGPYPSVIQVEIMARCNYGCCFANEAYKYRINNETKPDLIKIFEHIKSCLSKVEAINLFNFGEPLLHEGFCDFVKKCRKESAALSLCLATNGILMDEGVSRCLIEQKVNNVVVSVHGGPGTENMLRYSRYGADYDRVLANVKRLIELRKIYKSKLPIVTLRAVLFNWNDTDELMNRLRQDARKIGADEVEWILDGLVGGQQRSSKKFTFDDTKNGIIKECLH